MPHKASVSGFLSDNTESSIHGSILGCNNSWSPNLSIESESVLQDTSNISLQQLNNLSFYERVRTSANESDLSSVFSRGSLNGKNLKKIKRKPCELSNRSVVDMKLNNSSKTTEDLSSSSFNVSNIDDSFFKKPKDPAPKSPFSKSLRQSRNSKVSLDSSSEIHDQKKNVRKRSPRKNKNHVNVTSSNISVNLLSDSSSGSIDLSVIEKAMSKISSSPTNVDSPQKVVDTSPSKNSNRKRKLTELLSDALIEHPPDRNEVDSILQSPNLDETTISEKSQANQIITKKNLPSRRVSVKLSESFFDSENEDQVSIPSPVNATHLTRKSNLTDLTFSESELVNSFEGSISDRVNKKENKKTKKISVFIPMDDSTDEDSELKDISNSLKFECNKSSRRVSVKLSEALDDPEPEQTSVRPTKKTQQSSEEPKSKEIQTNLDVHVQSDKSYLENELNQPKPRKSILRKSTRNSAVGNVTCQYPTDGYNEDNTESTNDEKKNSIKTRKSSVQFKLDNSQTEDEVTNKIQTRKSTLRRSTRKSVTFSTDLNDDNSNKEKINTKNKNTLILVNIPEEGGNEVQKNKSIDKRISRTNTNGRQSCLDEIDMELTNKDVSSLSDFMDLTLKKSFTSQKVSLGLGFNTSIETKIEDNVSTLSKSDNNESDSIVSGKILIHSDSDGLVNSPNQKAIGVVPLNKRKSSVHIALDKTEKDIINYTTVNDLTSSGHMNTMEEYAALGLTLSGKSSVGKKTGEYTESVLATNSENGRPQVERGECNNLSENDSLYDAMNDYLKKIKMKDARLSNVAHEEQRISIQEIKFINERDTKKSYEQCDVNKSISDNFNESSVCPNSSITKSVISSLSFDEDLPSSTLIMSSKSELLGDTTRMTAKRVFTSLILESSAGCQEEKSTETENKKSSTNHEQENISDNALQSTARNSNKERASVNFNSDKSKSDDDGDKNKQSIQRANEEQSNSEKSIQCNASIGSSMKLTEIKEVLKESYVDVTYKTSIQDNLTELDDVSLSVDESGIKNSTKKKASVHFNFGTTEEVDSSENNQTSQNSRDMQNNSIISHIDVINKTSREESLADLDDVSHKADELVKSATRNCVKKRVSVHFNFDTTETDANETNHSAQSSNDEQNSSKISKASIGLSINLPEMKEVSNESNMDITNKTSLENVTELDDVLLSVNEPLRPVTVNSAKKQASVNLNFDTTDADDDNESIQSAYKEEKNTNKSKPSIAPSMNLMERNEISNESDMEATNKTSIQDNLSDLANMSLSVDESVRLSRRNIARKKTSAHFNLDTTEVNDNENNESSQISHDKQNISTNKIKSRESNGSSIKLIEMNQISNESDVDVTHETSFENLSELDDVSVSVNESVRSSRRNSTRKRTSVHFNFDTTDADDDDNESIQSVYKEQTYTNKSKPSIGSPMKLMEINEVSNELDVDATNNTSIQGNLSELDDVSVSVNESVRSSRRNSTRKRTSVHFNLDTTEVDDDDNESIQSVYKEQTYTNKSKPSIGSPMKLMEINEVSNELDVDATNNTSIQGNLSELDDVSVSVNESVRSSRRNSTRKRTSVHFNLDTTEVDDDDNESIQSVYKEQTNTNKSKPSIGSPMKLMEINEVSNELDVDATNNTSIQGNLSELDDVSVSVNESVRSSRRNSTRKRTSVHFNLDTTEVDDDDNESIQSVYKEQTNTNKSKPSIGSPMKLMEINEVSNELDVDATNKTSIQGNLSELDDVSVSVNESVRSSRRNSTRKRTSVHFNLDTTEVDDDDNESIQSVYKEQTNTNKSKPSIGSPMKLMEINEVSNELDVDATNNTSIQGNLSELDDVSVSVNESVRSSRRNSTRKRTSVHFNLDTTEVDDDDNESIQSVYKEQTNTNKSKPSIGSPMKLMEINEVSNELDVDATNNTSIQGNLSELDDVSVSVNESVRSSRRNSTRKRTSVHFNLDTTEVDDDDNESIQSVYKEQTNTNKSKPSIGSPMKLMEINEVSNELDVDATNKTSIQGNLSDLADISLSVDESVRSSRRNSTRKRTSVYFNLDTTEVDDNNENDQASQSSYDKQNSSTNTIKTRESNGSSIKLIEMNQVSNESDVDVTHKTSFENLSVLDDVSVSVDESGRSATRNTAKNRTSVHFNFDTTDADDDNENNQSSHDKQNSSKKSINSENCASIVPSRKLTEMQEISNRSDIDNTNNSSVEGNLTDLEDVPVSVYDSVRSETRNRFNKRASVQYNFDTTGAGNDDNENNVSTQSTYDESMKLIKMSKVSSESDMDVTHKTSFENLSELDDVSVSVDEPVRSATRNSPRKRASVQYNFDTTGAGNDDNENNVSTQSTYDESMKLIKMSKVSSESDMDVTHKTSFENLSELDDVSVSVDEPVRSATRNSPRKRASVQYNFDTTGAGNDDNENNVSTQSTYDESMKLIKMSKVSSESDMDVTHKTSFENLSELDDVSVSVDEPVRSATRNSPRKRASVHFNFDTTVADDDENIQSYYKEQNNTEISIKSKKSIGSSMKLTKMKEVLNESGMDSTNKTSKQDNLSDLAEVSLSVTHSALEKSDVEIDNSNSQKSMKSKKYIGLSLTCGNLIEKKISRQFEIEKNSTCGNEEEDCEEDNINNTVEDDNQSLSRSDNLSLDDAVSYKSTKNIALNRLSVNFALESSKTDEDNSKNENSFSYRESCVNNANESEFSKINKNLSLFSVGNKSTDSTLTDNTSVNAALKKKVSVHFALDNSEYDNDFNKTQKSVTNNNSVNEILSYNTNDTLSLEGDVYESFDSKLRNETTLNNAAENIANKMVSVNFTLNNSDASDLSKTQKSNMSLELSDENVVNDINTNTDLSVDSAGNNPLETRFTNDIPANDAPSNNVSKRVSVNLALDLSADEEVIKPSGSIDAFLKHSAFTKDISKGPNMKEENLVDNNTHKNCVSLSDERDRSSNTTLCDTSFVTDIHHVGSSMYQNNNDQKMRHVSVNIVFDETSIPPTDSIPSCEGDSIEKTNIQHNVGSPTDIENSSFTILHSVNELHKINPVQINHNGSVGVVFDDIPCQPDSTTSDTHLQNKVPLGNNMDSCVMVSENVVNIDTHQSKFIDKLSTLDGHNSTGSSESNLTLILEMDSPINSKVELAENSTENVAHDDLRCASKSQLLTEGIALNEPHFSSDLNIEEENYGIELDNSHVRITRSSLKNLDSPSTSILTKVNTPVLKKNKSSSTISNSSSKNNKRKSSGLQLEHSLSPKKVIILDISDRVQPPSLCDSYKTSEPEMLPLKCSENIGRMSQSNILPTTLTYSDKSNEKSIIEALQDSQISSSPKEVPDYLQTKRRSSRNSSKSPINEETNKKRYNLRKSSPNVSTNILVKRKSVTFGQNMYVSLSEGSSSDTTQEKSSTADAKKKLSNSKRNLNSGKDHVFIRPEVPSRRSKEGSGSMSKTSKNNFDEECQTQSYNSSLDLSEIPKDKTILQRKVIFHSTPIRPDLGKKKSKTPNQSSETSSAQKVIQSDKFIQVSKEGLGTSSSLRSSTKKSSDLSTSYSFDSLKHKTSEVSTSNSNNNKNAKRKREFSNINISERNKVSVNSYKSSSLFSSTPKGRSRDTLYTSDPSDSYKAVRFMQKVQFKDIGDSNPSRDNDYHLYSSNHSTRSEISGRSYHSGSMLSTLKNSNVSLSLGYGSLKNVQFRNRLSIIDTANSPCDFPSSPSTIKSDTSIRSIHEKRRQEKNFKINITCDSEKSRILSLKVNQDEHSQRTNRSTGNRNISMPSCGKETDSEYSMSTFSAVSERMKYVIPLEIGPASEERRGLKLRNNDMLIEPIFKKPKVQKYNFKNDPHFMINNQPYIEVKQKFPDKWVSKELYRFLMEKLKVSIEINAPCMAERIIKHLCGCVSAVKGSNTSEDILLQTFFLRKLLVKNEICSNQLEYHSLIMKFTPFDFQRKILPLARGFKISDSIVSEAESIDTYL